MTVKAQKFTPEVLLSAPRRSAGVPNAEGTSVLYTNSTYSFKSHDKTVELRCLDIKTKESTLLAKDNTISEPVWLSGEDDTFACLKSGDKGVSSILIASTQSGKSWQDISYTAGTIDAPASSLKLAQLSDSSYAIVVAAQASAKGELYNSETAPTTHSTGKLYNGLLVRHWDAYTEPQTNALWYGTLNKGKDGKFELKGWKNALKGTGLESPIAPFGGTDSFDVSSSGIIFVSKDPSINPALSVKCNVYFVSLPSFDEFASEKPYEYKVPGFKGASTSPVFSPDGKCAVFLSMLHPGYESDKNQIFMINDLKRDAVKPLLAKGNKGAWDRSPQSLAFSHDGKTLYMAAEDEGYGKLFFLPASPSDGEMPQALTEHGTVSDVRPLSNGEVFYTSSSLVDYSFYSIISTSGSGTQSVGWTHSASREGSCLGLNASQVSSIRTPASDPSVNKTVHSWVVKPSNFEAGQKYPVAYLWHGGPQGSWLDSWSTRWNPAIFAEQGYIAIAPNPVGSTGYGQAFTDRIRKDWGGAPYEDVVNVFDWVSEHMPEADNSKAVGLGASYGGYMVNWVQGHDLGRKLKALVCHDGIFSTTGLLATEELYFPFHDLGGTPWYAPPSTNCSTPEQVHDIFGRTSLSDWAKNDPSQFLDEWKTPQLVIHNSKDYRLCISEGLAAFNVLQARGVESQFLTFPDENHWVLKPENSLVWHKTVLNWINKYVGLEAYSEDEGEAFFGGIKGGGGEVVNMPAMGKPET